MTVVERLAHHRNDPAARRWAVAGGIVLAGHVLLLTIFALQRAEISLPAPVVVEPFFIDLTPRARPARTPPVQTTTGAPSGSPLPPIAVRPAAPQTRPAEVAPLEVDTPPPQVRPQQPGRVIPQSWRERCGLGDGPVSDAAWTACRDGIVQSAAPGERPPLGRQGDPSQDFAAQGRANIARYEYYRSPAPTGSGNARPSSTPGSNFGWGDMDRGVIYGAGSAPGG